MTIGRLDFGGASGPAPGSRRRSLARSRGLLLAAAALALGCDRPPAAPEASARPSSVTYAICQGNLASLQTLPPRHAGGPHAVAAQLDRRATAELEQLTRASLGASLEVTLGDRIFLRGPVQAPVRSGLLVNAAFASDDEAEHWLQVFRSELPAEPCGSEG